MTTKRRRETENETEVRMKRQRSRKRSSSEATLLHDPVNAEKRQVLKRLFGRNMNSVFEGEASSSGLESYSRREYSEPETFTLRETLTDRDTFGDPVFAEPEEFESHPPPKDEPFGEEEQCYSGDEYPDGDGFNLEDENSDPLLDSVPVDLDPERLGFLVCAQETLRFLNTRGFAFEHPVFSRLRSRLLRGMKELAVA